MSLDLDERQRAMLAEMNVRVWLPGADAADAQAPAPVQARAQAQGPAAPVAARPASPDEEPEGFYDDMPASEPVRRPAPAAPAHAPAPAYVPARPGAGVTRPVIALQPRPAGIESMDWPALQDAVAGCFACKLCASRKNTVFGVGDPQADWLIVGEAPGENEDIQGEPFVGQAGKLLDNMLKAIGLARGDRVFIANVLKCRPPANRNPEPEEVAQCEPYLRRQIDLLQPKIILAMGRFAVQSLLQTAEPIGKLRGRRHEFHGVPVIVTYHPAYLLRNLPDKAKAWADLCLAMSLVQNG